MSKNRICSTNSKGFFCFHVISICTYVYDFSVALVDDGYACSHVTAERSNYGRLIAASEENAKKRKEKRWANYVEEAAKEGEFINIKNPIKLSGNPRWIAIGQKTK